MPSPFDEIRIISQGDDFPEFDCGNEDFNDFIYNEAFLDMKRNYSVTYVGLKNGSIIAYIALAASTFRAALVKENEYDGEYRYRQFPAIKIARIAIDKNHQGLGYATFLIQYTFAILIKVRKYIGCFLITSDALPDRIQWYRKRGFKLPYGPKEKPGRHSYPMYFIIP